MAYGSFIVGGGGGTIPRIGQVIVTTLKDDSPAKRYKNTTWELVAQNRVPMGAGDGHEGGETVEAGLPNITGYFVTRPNSNDVYYGAVIEAAFAFAMNPHSSSTDNPIQEKDTKSKSDAITFDASRSNPIYGASNTVQPPAYYFHFWRRVS